MKQKIIVFSVVSFLVILCLTCKKGGDDKPQSVTWTINGGAQQAADTISFINSLGYSYVTGIKGTTKIWIGTSSTDMGSYSNLNANGHLRLTIAGTEYNQISSDITISSNSNSRLSGSFSGRLVMNVDTLNVSGTFNDVQYY
jgi:hypothetical protein